MPLAFSNFRNETNDPFIKLQTWKGIFLFGPLVCGDSPIITCRTIIVALLKILSLTCYRFISRTIVTAEFLSGWRGGRLYYWAGPILGETLVDTFSMLRSFNSFNTSIHFGICSYSRKPILLCLIDDILGAFCLCSLFGLRVLSLCLRLGRRWCDFYWNCCWYHCYYCSRNRGLWSSLFSFISQWSTLLFGWHFWLLLLLSMLLSLLLLLLTLTI